MTSNRGGGLYGHLGLIIPTSEHNNITGSSYTKTISSRKITNYKWSCNSWYNLHSWRIQWTNQFFPWNTCCWKYLKSQIIGAIDPIYIKELTNFSTKVEDKSSYKIVCTYINKENCAFFSMIFFTIYLYIYKKLRNHTILYLPFWFSLLAFAGALYFCNIVQIIFYNVQKTKYYEIWDTIKNTTFLAYDWMNLSLLWIVPWIKIQIFLFLRIISFILIILKREMIWFKNRLCYIKFILNNFWLLLLHD